MQKQIYEPIGSFITVDLPDVEEKSAAGIIKTPAAMKQERAEFTGAVKVIHVGPTTKQIVPGDKVLLGSNALLTEVDIYKRKLHQVDSYQVLGILKGK